MAFLALALAGCASEGGDDGDANTGERPELRVFDPIAGGKGKKAIGNLSTSPKLGLAPKMSAQLWTLYPPSDYKKAIKVEVPGVSKGEQACLFFGMQELPTETVVEAVAADDQLTLAAHDVDGQPHMLALLDADETVQLTVSDAETTVVVFGDQLQVVDAFTAPAGIVSFELYCAR